MPSKSKFLRNLSCYMCRQPKPAEIYLRDKSGDHSVCKECADIWADSDEEWPKEQGENGARKT